MAKNILQDYKKSKKKLLAPMNYLLQDKGWNVQYVEINHRYDLIPEILWVAILNEKFGIYKTSNVLSELIVLANKLNRDNDTFISSFASSWESHNFTKNELHTELEKNGVTEFLSEGLSGFIHLFPESPLSILVPHKATYIIGELKLIKDLIRKLSDNEAKETVFSMASVIYTAAICERLTTSSEIDISPQKLVDYPNTFDSLKIASTIRCTIKIFYGNTIMKTNNSWRKYFWQRCLELEPCKITTLDNG